MTRRPRSTSKLSLALIGLTGALSACSPAPSPDITRDQYASQQDCEADWGRPEMCEKDPSRTHHSHGFYYFGPSYANGSRAQAQMSAFDEAQRLGRPAASGFVPGNRAVGSAPASVSRGGFGSTGAHFSAGG